MRSWSEIEDKILRELYSDTRNVDIAETLGRSKGAIDIRAFNLGLKKSEEMRRKNSSKGWFRKGHIPDNKGKRWSEFMSEEGMRNSSKTTFKKGHIPKNHKPVGTEVLEPKDGYVKVKIAEPNKWKLKHRYIWEQHHGKIPRGYNVQFHNKDRTDCRIENLYLISRSEQISNNSIIRYPQEVRTAIKRISKIKKLIRQNENND